MVKQLIKEMMDDVISKIDSHGIKKPPMEILNAFYEVPRHLFIPHLYEENKGKLNKISLDYNNPDQEILKKIYVNSPLAILVKEDSVISTSSQPIIMALMLDDLKIKPGNKVFEIGTGSGYNAAIMAQISGKQENIITSEIQKEVAELAISNLERAGFGDVNVITSDGGEGYAKKAPYNNIIVTCGAPNIPWINQLSNNGTIAMPLVTRGIETLCSLTKQDDGILKGYLSLFVRFLHLEGMYSDKQHFSKNIGSLQRLVKSRGEQDNYASKKLEEILISDGDDKIVALQKSKKRQNFEFFLALTDDNAMVYVSDTKNYERGYSLWHTQKEMDKNGLVIIFPKEIISFGNKATTEFLIDSFTYWKELGEPGIQDYDLLFYPSEIKCDLKQNNNGGGWVVQRKSGTTVFNLREKS